MEELRQKYAGRDVEFLAMYVREPHPEERGFPEFRQHESYDQKMDYARRLVDVKELELPVMVDGIDQRYHETLGNLPNMGYVVDKEGKVRYASTWLLADEVDRVLAELVTADDPTRPVEPTIDTSRIGPEI